MIMNRVSVSRFPSVSQCFRFPGVVVFPLPPVVSLDTGGGKRNTCPATRGAVTQNRETLSSRPSTKLFSPSGLRVWLTMEATGLKVRSMNDEAPNFSGEYPNAGVMIGPAWRAAWQHLADGREVMKHELVAVMVVCSGVKPKTAENLLRQGRVHRLLTTTVRQVNSRRHAIYRRADR